MDEIRINVPEGMEIDKENSTFECIKFKPKLNIKRGDFVYVKSKRGIELKFIYKETSPAGLLFGWDFFSNGTMSNHVNPMIKQNNIDIIRRMDDIEYGASMDAMKRCELRWNPDTLEVEKIDRLPKTWEEFCNAHASVTNDYYISTTSKIVQDERSCARRAFEDRNNLPNKETAEAFLALMQLIQLRDCYNDGWKPDWKNDSENKYCIVTYDNNLTAHICNLISHVLAFKTEELCDQFIENFRDLIEIAKPLI